jgi:hypothetical protein
LLDLRWVGIKRGVKSAPDPQKPFIYGPGPSRKPDSALSRHPSPGENSRAPSGSRAYQPDNCRDNLACSHRWFTWPVPRGIPPVGSYPTLSPITCDRVTPIHRLVCSLLHLTWRRACAAPPLGLLARAAFPDRGMPWSSRVRTLLCASGENPGHSGGSDGPDPRWIIP